MRTALLKTFARVTTTALVGGVAAVGAVTLPAHAATGTVVTDSGTGVTIRSGNATTFGSVGNQPNGAVEIDCQIYGEPVTGKFGRSLVWDHIPGKGFITDSYVNTGSSGLVAPLCTSNPRADKAIAWYAARSGSTAYQGLCEKAAENSYGKDLRLGFGQDRLERRRLPRHGAPRRPEPAEGRPGLLGPRRAVRACRGRQG